MPDPAKEKGARTVLATCAGLRKGEHLLLIKDADVNPDAEALARAAEKAGAKVTVLRSRGAVGREPSGEIAGQMLRSDLTMFSVNEERTLIWGHSDAKLNALKKGRRVLFLTQAVETAPSESELRKIRERTNRLADIIERSSEITLVTGKGFRLELALAGRKALRLSSLLSDPGSWGAVPDYAEAGVAPLETGSNGTFRVDGLIMTLGKVTTPVDLRFESGRLVEINGGRMARDFDTLLGKDPSSRVLAELGFGTNHLRRDVRGEFDDKKGLGCVHIAMGDNHTFGGMNRAPLHVDCMATRPQVFIDGSKFDLESL